MCVCVCECVQFSLAKRMKIAQQQWPIEIGMVAGQLVKDIPTPPSPTAII